jgi:RNA polymerase sigma-70 factor, ECF subfamily
VILQPIVRAGSVEPRAEHAIVKARAEVVRGDAQWAARDLIAVDGVGGQEALDAGQMLEGCRQYLLMIANDVLGPELQGKLGASDLVQDTFLEAQEHLAVFRGRGKPEMRAWLRRILECRLANVRRKYLVTEKRAAAREVPIDPLLASGVGPCDALASRLPSPSEHAAQNEWAQVLEHALLRLPDHYRQAIVLRHQQQLSWEEIGKQMSCTSDAARKVWSRAIEQLREALGEAGTML